MSAPIQTSDPLDTSLPSVRQIQHYARDKQGVVVQLTTGASLAGQIFWQDPNCLCIKEESGELVMVWRHALASLRCQEGAGNPDAPSSGEEEAM
jgi:host factor-I protein